MEQDVDSKTTHAHLLNYRKKTKQKENKQDSIWTCTGMATDVDRLIELFFFSPTYFCLESVFFFPPLRWAMNETTYGHPIKLCSLFCNMDQLIQCRRAI